jgi:thioredoxin 1
VPFSFSRQPQAYASVPFLRLTIVYRAPGNQKNQRKSVLNSKITLSLTLLAAILVGFVGWKALIHPGNASDSKHGPVVKLTSANFEQLVLKSEKPVLVDFWATWCGPCVAMTPTVEKLATQFEGKVVVGKLNVDEAKNLAAKYEISSIPAFLLFKNGKVLSRSVGGMTIEELASMLDNVN